MRNLIKSAAISLSLVFVGSTAMGAGFALYEFSARGNAMGGAVMANKAEAASLAVNPALITQIEGSQVQAGATFVIPNATAYVNDDPRSLESRVFTLPNVYATYQASENVFLGLAGFSRFGLGGSYDNYKTWPGAAIAYKFDLVTYSVTPTIAAKVTDELSLSMGLEFMYVNFKEDKWIAATGGTNVHVGGDGTGWGGNFGAYYKPDWAPKWGFGASYRTKMRHIVDGELKTTGVQIPGMTPPSDNVRGSVTLPDAFNFGMSFAPVEKLVLEAGVVATFWSSYDAIRIEYKNLPAPTLIERKNYKDTYRLNLGAEYALNNNWDIRGGYAFDKTPTNDKYMDTLVPVGDRHLFNAGVGYKYGVWGIDASYTYLLGADMSGAYGANTLKYTNADTHMLGLTFKYSFGQRFLRGS